MLAISELLQNVTFIHSHFENSFNLLSRYDYVYCDPPYVPENKTSFVDYNSDGFTIKEHKSLFEKLIELKKKDIKFSLSNSKVPMLEEYFQKDCGWAALQELRGSHVPFRRANGPGPNV